MNIGHFSLCVLKEMESEIPAEKLFGKLLWRTRMDKQRKDVRFQPASGDLYSYFSHEDGIINVLTAEMEPKGSC